MNESSPEPQTDQNREQESSEFDEIYDLIDRLEASLTRLPGSETETEGSPSDEAGRRDRPLRDTHDPRLTHVPRWKPLHLILFVLTCLSTFFVGAFGGVRIPSSLSSISSEQWAVMLSNGLTYSGAVMAILLSHEMGHYLQARRYHVAASPPYFIPMPFTPLGTMGAVIIQYSGYADRKKLYDIAISGPLAGLVLALPIAWLGIRESVVAPLPEGAMVFGDPLIMQWMYEIVHGPLGPNEDVVLNPLLFAGWVGIFITGLNLIPVGQLDGGHILYSLIGKRAHTVAMLVLGGAMAYMVYTSNYAFSLMILLLLFMGPRHPPTANDDEDLGWFRIVLGWLTLAFIIIGFTPNPISIH
jgi:membrane-associated protease RseP (regulator of RpoE activity)